jgi:hypothetical protein
MMHGTMNVKNYNTFTWLFHDVAAKIIEEVIIILKLKIKRK